VLGEELGLHTILKLMISPEVAGVYRVAPGLGTITLVVDNFVFPNGLAFSPDESLLYVNILGAVKSVPSTFCPTA
jgi:sugar lactone lactonase YvrE